ncbi:7-deoxyloganetin glucosyltransferase [Artemisia annua]|uniref:7-deoxyloganetin glucosyltransferase n=1 Tax=Artemisia annua TaxID=35608 RepID=A0A2U1P0R9_ARTAN|nr:7-deoxyloganetin glucosyltransferase [Artemisia annua]
MQKPHAVCIPFPAQGHINPMLKLAKILNSKGFHITYINTEFNHQRLLKSQGSDTLNRYLSFQFETIPDGLPPLENLDATQDLASLFKSSSENCLEPFKRLLAKLNATILPVTCIVSDGAMSFTLDAAEELGIPDVLFWTPSACGLLGYAHYITFKEKELIPLKGTPSFALLLALDPADLTNGYMDTIVDCIPSMKGMHLKDMPTLLRTTDPEDILINFLIRETSRSKKASAIVLKTFDELESDVLNELSSIYPRVYTIGPIHTIANSLVNKDLQLLAVEAAAEFLNKAVKPVIVGGPKLRTAHACQAILELADDSGYFLVVTPTSKGLVPECHPQFMGTYSGGVRTTFCAEIVESADVYVLAGPMFDDGSSGYSILLKKE